MNTETKKTTRRGRPVNPQLKDDIICTAGELFSQLGLHATTMELIAAKLKISKLTLYKRFSDKESLFAAVIQKKCMDFVPDLDLEKLANSEPKTALHQICFGLMQLLVSDAALGMERMLMALEERDRAKLTRLYYREGPERVLSLITRYLADLNCRSVLKIDNPRLAANFLGAMVKGSDICTRRQLHVCDYPTKEEMSTYCDQIVSFFIKAFSSDTKSTC